MRQDERAQWRGWNSFNTMSGKVERLEPVGAPALRMYACGPTIYDYGHIGNFRTFLHVDVLRRFLRQQGMAVEYAMNVTDVDDKIIHNALAAGKGIAEYTARFEKAFFEDMAALGIERPEHVPRATEHIPEMVGLIEQLAAKDIAYQTEDGSWYFRIAKFPAYGKLSKKDLEGMEDGARVDADEYEKEVVRDFALWKAAKDGETELAYGAGRGTAGMAYRVLGDGDRVLGESFDLHAGGEDLMFPHHENEIAQSESASGKTFARHWMHVRFLLVEGKKMSKSLGNFYTLRDLLLKGHRASAIRYLLLSVPYRHQMNFTFEGLAAATNAIERLRTFHQRMLRGGFAAGGECGCDGGDGEGCERVYGGAGERSEYGGGCGGDQRDGAGGELSGGRGDAGRGECGGGAASAGALRWRLRGAGRPGCGADAGGAGVGRG